MSEDDLVFNSPPGWDIDTLGWTPPYGWRPPAGWTPHSDFPAAPSGWDFWIAPSNANAKSQTPVAELITRRPVDETSTAPSPSEPRQKDGNARAQARIAELELEVQRLNEALAATGSPVDLDDERVLQEVGIYRYHHPLEHAADYKERLAAIGTAIKDMAKAGDAILASDLFTYNNSLAKGRKMTAEFSKLMLRAYNAEADNCVRSLRAGNVVTARRRLEASVAAVAKLGAMMEMHVNPAYHRFRLDELELTADYLMKVQVEKEEAREERERLREERKAEQELAAERERLDKERTHYVNALQALRESGDEEALAELEERLGAINQAIEHNDFRAANIRAGYVYVISNVGAFGPNIVKIGLTRRLEPMDRVRELSGASVPFPFDVHALFFAEDAVSVESELHHAFSETRVNQVNLRREFFFATPSEVRRVLLEKQAGNLLEFVENPDATQFHQSKKYWGPYEAGPGVH
ncbi:MAG: DUF4041 domain-containing protein [Patulibacter minatonensis]